MSDDPRDSEVRPELADDLAAMYGAPVSVPRKVDDAILNRARAKLAGTRRLRPLRWVGAAAAAAAAVLLVARVSLHVDANPDDIDGNRRVDIVDALKLSHQIQTGAKGRDINGDGVVDQADVDALAMAVVRLDAKGGLQ